MSDTLSSEAEVAPSLWGARRHQLKRSQRLVIGLMAATFELMLMLLLFLAFSAKITNVTPMGAGTGLSLFASFGSGQAPSKTREDAIKTIHPNDDAPSSVAANSPIKKPHPIPPIPLPTRSLERPSASEANAVDVGAGSGSAAGIANAGGGDAYDPYAGASPQYRSDLSGQQDKAEGIYSPEALSGLVTGLLNRTAHTDADHEAVLVAQLRADILKSEPFAKGNITLDILSDPVGMVIDARVIESTATLAVAVRARQLLIGRQAGVVSEQWRRLPLLHL